MVSNHPEGPGLGCGLSEGRGGQGDPLSLLCPGPSHLSLLHLWAPLVMVKPPVSSCWTCMARRRAEGRVGWARKRRPSIRHRLSLLRKTWDPARGAGRRDSRELRAQCAAQPVPLTPVFHCMGAAQHPDLYPIQNAPGFAGLGIGRPAVLSSQAHNVRRHPPESSELPAADTADP